MANHVATGSVHPHPGIVGTWRIGDENEAIPGVQSVNDLCPLTEDRSVNGRAEVIVMRGVWR